MSEFREYIGVISHDDFVNRRDEFQAKIQSDAIREMRRLGFVVKDQITDWIKKPSFLADDIEWACRVICIVADDLEGNVHG